jgi:hypothetical protein
MILHKIKKAKKKSVFFEESVQKKFHLSLIFCVGLEKKAKFYFSGCFSLKFLILVFNFPDFSKRNWK